MFINPRENILRAGVGEGMYVGDFGVGSGAYTTELLPVIRDQGRVFAVDVQFPLLRRLEEDLSGRGVKNVEYLHGDLEKPYGSKLNDEVLDFGILSNVLFQAKQKQAVLTELRRVLRRKGRFLLVDWQDSFDFFGPHQDQILHPDDARLLADLTGFRYVKPVSAGKYHYGMVFEKL